METAFPHKEVSGALIFVFKKKKKKKKSKKKKEFNSQRHVKLNAENLEDNIFFFLQSMQLENN